MKYSLLLVGALLTAGSTSFAQNDCSKNHRIFNFEHSGSPKQVTSLGSNPEFPFLRNLSSPRQVLAAMKNNSNAKGGRELNKLLREIGFERGVSDVKLTNISAAKLPSGTTGNMGDGNYNTAYSRLEGNPNGFKAWKVTSDNGCSMYFMAKCGNAFAANNIEMKDKTACVSMPVNITTEPKFITSGTTAAAKRVDEKKVYIYYHKKRFIGHDARMARKDIPDNNPSRPLLLRSTKKAEFVPQEYKVTVTPQDDKVSVCPDKPVDVAANINVEYSSEYAGYYPNKTNKVYKEVSKRVYKKSIRKMCKAKRKEAEVAALTDVRVN